MRRTWHDRSAEHGTGPAVAGERRRSLARALLLMAIVALSLAALAAIAILLFGSFGETEGKILLTVLAIAGYSLTGLAATTALGREPVWLGPIGLATSAVGFALFGLLIWAEPQGDTLGRLMGTFVVLAVAIAHAALLLLLTRRAGGGSVLVVRRATLVASSVLSVMLIVPMLFAWDPTAGYFRLAGAVAVLAVLGTLLVPILWKLGAEAGAPTLWAAGATAAGDGDARLEMRYGGRTFIIQAGYRERPPAGFAVTVWEVTHGGHQRITGMVGPETHGDPHAALAVAVERITTAVDEDDRSRRWLNDQEAVGLIGGTVQMRALSGSASR